MQPINGDSSIKLITALAAEQDTRINTLRHFPNGLPVDVNDIITEYDQDNSKLEEAVGAILNENKYYLHRSSQPTFIEPRMQELLQTIGRLQHRIHSLVLDPEYLFCLIQPNPHPSGTNYRLDPRYRFATITKFLPNITKLSFACERTIDSFDNILSSQGGVLAVTRSFQKLEFLDLSKRHVTPNDLREILKLPHLKRLKIVECIPALEDPIPLKDSAPHIEIIDQEPLPVLG